jgi:Glyoxalase-like domain
VQSRVRCTTPCKLQRDCLYTGLGFVLSENGRHPTGTENSAVLLRDGYLELIAPYDTTLSGGPLGGGHGYAEYLKRGDGARAAGLEIASAEQTARDLDAAGLKIKGPRPEPSLDQVRRRLRRHAGGPFRSWTNWLRVLFF